MMSEFDEQTQGVMPRQASDLQLEDQGMTQGTSGLSNQEYDQTNRQLMGFGGVKAPGRQTGIWQDDKGMWHSDGANGGGGVNMGPSGYAEMQKALDIYGSIDYARPEADPNAGTFQTPDAGGAGAGDQDTWRYGSPGDKRAASGGRTGGTIYQGPTYAYPEFDVPEFEFGGSLDLPDYEPPEYDEAYAKSAREEFIMTNKGAMTEAAQSAILNTASMDNPNARAKLIQGVLEGFGESLKQTALAGSQEGRRAAGEKYGRDINVYNVQFETASTEEMARYDKSLKEDMLNWEMDVQKVTTQYNQNLAGYGSMPVDKQKESYDEWVRSQGRSQA
jgi:hypothetical protein